MFKYYFDKSSKIMTDYSKMNILKVSVNENFSTLLDFVFLGFLA